MPAKILPDETRRSQQSIVRRFQCAACRQFYNRKSDKLWIKSYCDKTGKMTRLIQVWSKAELRRAKQQAEKWKHLLDDSPNKQAEISQTPSPAGEITKSSKGV